jgi:hypothetical protein
MHNDIEKKEKIEKLIDAWLEVLPNSVRSGYGWQEEDIKTAMRKKAYDLYGISS